MAYHNRVTTHHTSKPSFISEQEIYQSPSSHGGESMVWNYSNDSNNSARSRKTSSSSYYSVSSPTLSYGSTSASSTSQAGFSRYPTSTAYSDYMESPPRSESTPRSFVRSTPSSLGWLPDTKLWKLYKFVVTKGKEPYLELLPDYVWTRETPERVYLDQPKNPRKNTFPCQFPGGCSGKRVFSRPADLDRHYKNVHASVDQKDCFPCDYGPCARAKDPFTRKDHYRDHLKDFHKEDIGSAKAGKVEKGSAKWQQMQEQWLKERRISSKSWRCARCLGRVRVEEHGWVCGRCGVECERSRIEAREELRRKEEASRGKREGSTSAGSSSKGKGKATAYHSGAGTSAAASSELWTYPEHCGTCNNTGWIDDVRTGGLVTCYKCQPASTAYGVSDWGQASYPTESSSYYY